VYGITPLCIWCFYSLLCCDVYIVCDYGVLMCRLCAILRNRKECTCVLYCFSCVWGIVGIYCIVFYFCKKYTMVAIMDAEIAMEVEMVEDAN